jgi:ferrous iron transport protein A
VVFLLSAAFDLLTDEILMKTISQLKIGEQAVISKIQDSPLAVKLMEMGILPGVSVKVTLKAPFGDPLAIELLNYQLSLRKEEADLVEIGAK